VAWAEHRPAATAGTERRHFGDRLRSSRRNQARAAALSEALEGLEASELTGIITAAPVVVAAALTVAAEEAAAAEELAARLASAELARLEAERLVITAEPAGTAEREALRMAARLVMAEPAE